MPLAEGDVMARVPSKAAVVRMRCRSQSSHEV